MDVPHIPVVPIGYRNAARLLADLRGNGFAPPASGGSRARAARFPQSWQGGLPSAITLGPGRSRTRLRQMQSGQEAYHTIWDTFGIRGYRIPRRVGDGRRPPGRLGSRRRRQRERHVSVLEAAGHSPRRRARATGRSVRSSLRPGTPKNGVSSDRRNTSRMIRFASCADAVAYSEPGCVSRGPQLRRRRVSLAPGSPARYHPGRAAPGDREHASQRLRVGGVRAPGSADSLAARSSGIPAADPISLASPITLAFRFSSTDSAGPVASTTRPTTTMRGNPDFGDPGSCITRQRRRIGAALLLRLANADVVPFDYVEYARTMRRYLTGIDESIKAKGWSTSTAPLATAIDGMERAATAFALARDSALGTASARP